MVAASDHDQEVVNVTASANESHVIAVASDDAAVAVEIASVGRGQGRRRETARIVNAMTVIICFHENKIDILNLFI